MSALTESDKIKLGQFADRISDSFAKQAAKNCVSEQLSTDSVLPACFSNHENVFSSTAITSINPTGYLLAAITGILPPQGSGGVDPTTAATIAANTAAISTLQGTTSSQAADITLLQATSASQADINSLGTKFSVTTCAPSGSSFLKVQCCIYKALVDNDNALKTGIEALTGSVTWSHSFPPTIDCSSFS
jgi:hypothetical protein